MNQRVREFETRVSAYIGRQGLFHGRSPVVVAFSGGSDSVALLAVLHRLGYDCRAAHCNFHLRGEESMRDMRHCMEVCRRLAIDLSIRDFDVEAYRDANPGVSVEMACRELRYAWFDELLDAMGAQAVAVGHHRADRVETFLLNLLRGTGIAGLTSMRPRSRNVVRPLLECDRADMREYISALGLEYVDDSTNAANDYRRNFLRNSILPQLDEVFTGASDAIMRTISNLEGVEAIYRDAIDAKIAKYRKGNIVDLGELMQEQQAATVLFEMLKPLTFTASQISDIMASASASGASFYSTDGRVCAEISHGMLEISDSTSYGVDADEYPVNLQHDISEPVHIAVSFGAVEDFRPEGSPSVAYFDASAVGGDSRWALRHPRRGDRMVPFGGKKSKLLSDFFANAKFSASQKRRQWVLTCNGEIVWLPGLRCSSFAAIGSGTKRFVRLEMKN